ncbi:MAG: C40 family peptidase [Clostridia bacterium]|nr:C40 family peptidase [Clostridia bacterium]
MKNSIKKLRLLLLAVCLTATTAFTACGARRDQLHSGNNSEIVSPLPDGETGEDTENGTPEQPDGNGGNGNNAGNNGNGGVQTPVVKPQETPKTEYIRVTASNVNIRSGAGTGYSVLGTAEKGTMYAIIGKSGNWYKTYYKNQTAYLYAEYAAVFSLQKSKNAKTEKVIEEGYKLLGVPYVYGAVRLHDGKGNMLGGFTAKKFDCSSLVQYVFYKGAGVLLNVTTRTQVTQGKYVAPADLERGDCIYFTNEERKYKTGIERVGHVAIYLGDGYILHTASDYARIEKMSTQRWNFYIEARRFV